MNVTRDVLHRFRHRLMRQRRAAEAAEAHATVEALKANPNATDDQLGAAVRRIFQVQLLDCVMDPTRQIESNLAIIAMSERIRVTDLSAKRLALKETKTEG